MQEKTDNLTLEQLFACTKFKALVEKMSLDQSKMMLLEMHRQMMIQSNHYQQILKHHWFSDLK
jgi:hypothetical protein